MTAIATLNASVQQIEAMLREGSSIEDVAEFYSEPRQNVYAVKRAMDAAGTAQPRQTAQPSRPLATVPAIAEPSIESLIAASRRSTSTRTQHLGTKLFDLATTLRERLADEREAAEKKQRIKAEREAAAAEVARLEQQLREARAKLAPTRKHVMTEAGRANIRANAAKGQAAAAVDSPCRKNCGFVAKSRAGRVAHERHCNGPTP